MAVGQFRALSILALLLRAELVNGQAAAVYDPSKGGEMANCVVDVGISAVFLGKAALNINQAIKVCTLAPIWDVKRRAFGLLPPSLKTRMQQAACSASVNGILAGFLYSASFASLAASDCQKSLTPIAADSARSAMCTKDFTGFLASMALIGQAGSQIYLTCDGPIKKLKLTPEQRLTLDSARRLDATDAAPERDYTAFMDGDKLNATMVAETLESATRRLSKYAPGAPIYTVKDFADKQREDMEEREAHIEEEMQKEARRLSADGLNASERDLFGVHTPIKDIIKTGIRIAQRSQIRQAAEAQCAFDIGQATFFLTRAALMINSAVRDCSASNYQGGLNKGRAMCSVDITSMVGAFSFVASGISFAIFQCPTWQKNLEAACAGAIINIVAAISEMAAAASDFDNSCGPTPPPPKKEGGLRRLDDGANVV